MLKVEPLVSVLMTAYNREKYIAEAIESVLCSNYLHFELIIVDDNSIDNTLKIALAYQIKDERVRVYRNIENLGQFKNRNKAFSYAKGEYIKFFDSDDVMYPNCLDVMICCMQKFPNAGVGSLFFCDLGVQLPIEFNPRESFINHYFLGESILYVGPSGSIYKSRVFSEFGGFNEQIGILADTLLMLQIVSKYNIVGFQTDLLYWRVHSEQVTVGQLDWLQMQKERYSINEIVLNSSSTPLNAMESAVIRRNLKSILIRNLLRQSLLNLKFIEGYKLIIFCKLNLTDFLKACIPNKKRNKSWL